MKRQQDKTVAIYAMAHKRYEPYEDNIYVPLQVGYANSQEKTGFLHDFSGDNISGKNPYYSELTGMYWMWKNVKDADIVGLCHYRRYLLNSGGKIFNKQQIQQALLAYDVMTTRKVTLDYSYFEAFGGRHNREDLLQTRAAIQLTYPEYLEDFDRAVRQNRTYFGNMLIAEKKVFDDYAEWLFTILFEAEKRIDMTGYNDYQKRVFGFLSEILFMVYFEKKKMRILECDVAVIGEKKETEETEERIRECFRNRDLEAAKAVFMDVYKKRPDILMEASDTKGHLRLCLQMITIFSAEEEAYGKNYLAVENDLTTLLDLFKQLNREAKQTENGKWSKEFLAWAKEHSISEIALKTTLKIVRSYVITKK